MRTYFEATGEGDFALHASMDEMTFILDLVNSVSHPPAAAIRRVMEQELRGHNRLTLNIKREVKLCRKCGGSEFIRDYNLRTEDYDTVNCDDCGKTGRTVKITTVRYEKFQEKNKIEIASSEGT